MRLSQKGDGPQVAKRLIDVYFALFKVVAEFVSISISIFFSIYLCLLLGLWEERNKY